MAKLLLKHIRAAVTCDDQDRVLEHIDILCEEGRIRAMGPDLDAPAAKSSTAPACSAIRGL